LIQYKTYMLDLWIDKRLCHLFVLPLSVWV